MQIGRGNLRLDREIVAVHLLLQKPCLQAGICKGLSTKQIIMNYLAQKHRVKLLSLTLFLFASLSGNSLMAQEQDSKTLSEEKKALWTSFCGEYETRPNENIKVLLDSSQLKIHGPGQPQMLLKPTTDPMKFYLKEFGVHILFVKDEDKIGELKMIRGDGQELSAPKIK